MDHTQKEEMFLTKWLLHLLQCEVLNLRILTTAQRIF